MPHVIAKLWPGFEALRYSAGIEGRSTVSKSVSETVKQRPMGGGASWRSVYLKPQQKLIFCNRLQAGVGRFRPSPPASKSVF